MSRYAWLRDGRPDTGGGAGPPDPVSDLCCRPSQIPKLQREGINLEVRSILNANQMLLAKEQATLDLSNWDEDLIAKVGEVVVVVGRGVSVGGQRASAGTGVPLHESMYVAQSHAAGVGCEPGRDD